RPPRSPARSPSSPARSPPTEHRRQEGGHMPSRTTTRPTQGQAQAQQVEQPTRGEVLKAELVRAARRAHHHERGKVALLAPVGWLGTLHAAALGMDAAGLHPLLWAGITGVGAVGVLGRAERRGEDLPWAPTAAGALWMLGASIFGPYGWVAIILWVAGIIGFAVPAWMRTLDRISQRSPKEKMPIWGGALGWVRRNDQANPSEEEPEAGELPPEPEPARTWREVGVPDSGDLTGTRLANIERVPGGYSGLIVGTPGVTKFSKITSSAETIASAFGVHVSEVTVEETPDMNSSRAQLTVITEGTRSSRRRCTWRMSARASTRKPASPRSAGTSTAPPHTASSGPALAARRWA